MKTPLELLYEDRHILIVKKPAGLFSQGGADDSAEDLVSILTERETENGVKEPYIGVVHRLDCGVGGAIVYAKKPYAAGLLSAAFAGHEVCKEYLCVVDGPMEAPEGELRDLLYKDARKNKVFIVDRKRAGVKEAVLHYTVLAQTEHDGQMYSLLKIRLGTGRSHQIRAQLSGRAHPIVGDGKYGSRIKCQTQDGTPALGLWSFHLAFRHPANLEREKDGRRANPNAPKFTDPDIICLPDTDLFPFSLFADTIRKLKEDI